MSNVQSKKMRIIQRLKLILILLCVVISLAQAQFATIGGGLLVSERPSVFVAELNAQTPQFFNSRAYMTLSWTEQSEKPTAITAIERSLLNVNDLFYTNIGAGFLWLEYDNYKPHSMLVSSTIVPLPVPRTSLVAIGSVLPFQDFDWSVVLKVGWAIWFIE